MATPTNTNIDFWKSMWANRHIVFHNLEVHPMLERNIDKFIAGREKCRVFFPLCGKAVDMAWLAAQGHEVVGVEVVEDAVKEFFDENSIGYTIRQDHDFKVYEVDLMKLLDLPVNRDLIFCCFFNRGSIVAILPKDRQKYSKIILDLLDENFTYLVNLHRYNPESYGGPPHFISDEEIAKLFGSVATAELLERQINVKYGIPNCTDDLLLLLPKTV